MIYYNEILDFIMFKICIFVFIFRYDIEIDRSRRLVIKKIMERDDIVVKRFVLCVFEIILFSIDIFEIFSSKIRSVDIKKVDIIEFIDGWYVIKVYLDFFFLVFLKNGRLIVG